MLLKLAFMIYYILHLDTHIRYRSPLSINRPLFKNKKKIEKKNPPEFRDIAPNKGINKKNVLK